jgi:hypothetical protein
MPAQQSRYDDQNPPISQAVQIWGEGAEIVPYAAGFIPPSTFLPGLGGAGGNGGSGGFGTGGESSSSMLPQNFDLSWVASDTASFTFFFAGVCWTEIEPADALGLTWVNTIWESQVRNPNWYYWGYWWPPTWPGYRYVMTFTVAAEFVADHNGEGPGTLVTLTGGTIWPGEFVWDLQARSFADPVNAPDVYTTRTWITGKATVDPQVTQQDYYPPSHWSVYPYP